MKPRGKKGSAEYDPADITCVHVPVIDDPSYDIAPEVTENFRHALTAAISTGAAPSSCQGFNDEVFNALYELACEHPDVTTTSIQAAHTAWQQWASGVYGRELFETVVCRLFAHGYTG